MWTTVEVEKSGEDTRVALVYDADPMSKALLADALEHRKYQVICAGSPVEAMNILRRDAVDLAVVGIDHGQDGLADLLHDIVMLRMPAVCVSDHGSPQLVVDCEVSDIDINMLVRSCCGSTLDLEACIEAATRGRILRRSARDGELVVTPLQASVLRMMTAGYSNPKIAEELGASRRTVEHTIRRTYRSLNLAPSPDRNQRVDAINLCRSGKVRVTQRGKNRWPGTGSNRRPLTFQASARSN